MSSPFRQQTFKDLQSQWYKKLKQNGFNDIENSKEEISSINRRTARFDDRDLVLSFFISVDHFITENPDLPKLHRQILVHYSDGIKLIEIAPKVKKSVIRVKQIISRYRKIILSPR